MKTQTRVIRRLVSYTSAIKREVGQSHISDALPDTNGLITKCGAGPIFILRARAHCDASATTQQEQLHNDASPHRPYPIRDLSKAHRAIFLNEVYLAIVEIFPP